MTEMARTLGGNGYIYFVGLEQGLHEFRTRLMLDKRPGRAV